MIVAIIGSREGLDWPRVSDAIRDIVSRPDVGTVVSGGAIGVDKLAESLALAAGKRTHVIRPKWKRGDGTIDRAAGMRRNAEIVDLADEVHAFWDGRSPGTKGAIDIARRVRKPVVVYEMTRRSA